LTPLIIINITHITSSIMAATTTQMHNTAMSVDDLVNSFGASSIGQEARDLAALQAQLAATLFASSSASSFSQAQQPFASTSAGANAFASSSRARTNSTSLSIPVQRGRSHQHQHQQHQHQHQHQQRCTTPLARTPSSSSFYDANGMDEDYDERMVEDLLLPSPSPNTSSSYHPSYPSAFPSTTSYHHPQQHTDAETEMEADHDLFATTDPFFLAQVQAQKAAEAARLERQERLRAGMQNGAFMAPPSAFGASMGMNMSGYANGSGYRGGYTGGGFATASAF
jgi:hypothetical protein